MSRKELFFNLKISLLAFLLAFFVVEIVLALLGIQGSFYAHQNSGSPYFSDDKQQSLIVEDPVRGWAPASGTFQQQIVGSARKYMVSINESGSRRTSDSNADAELLTKRQIFLIGCSITFGFGLNDIETLGFKLQSSLPNTAVHNFAVSGYGTYQSLLTLQEKVLDKLRPGDLVVYGFCQCHVNRNVAHPDYLFGLASRSSTGNIAMPYCDLKSEQLICYKPAPFYKEDVLRFYSRAANLLQIFLQSTRIDACDTNKIEVTNRLISRMHNQVQDHDGLLLVFPVDSSSSSYVRQHSLEQSIHLLECPDIDAIDKRWRLHDDPHPNAEWTTAISKCLASRIKRLYQEDSVQDHQQP